MKEPKFKVGDKVQWFEIGGFGGDLPTYWHCHGTIEAGPLVKSWNMYECKPAGGGSVRAVNPEHIFAEGQYKELKEVALAELNRLKRRAVAHYNEQIKRVS